MQITRRKEYLKTANILMLLLIGVFCVFYSVFWSDFAETHIRIAGLDFPVFVGEILLGACIVMTLFKWLLERRKFNKAHLALLAYLVWLLIKAAEGYFNHSPYALRNAAMFYYPLFALVTYYAWEKKFWNEKTLALILFLISFLISFNMGMLYYYFTFWALSVVVSLSFRKTLLRVFLLLALLLIFPFENFFCGSKTYLIGNTISFMVLGFFLIVMLSKSRLRWMLWIFLILFVFYFFMRVPVKTQIVSLTTPKKIVHQYQERMRYVEEKRNDYERPELPVMIYNDNLESRRQQTKARTAYIAEPWQDRGASLAQEVSGIENREGRAKDVGSNLSLALQGDDAEQRILLQKRGPQDHAVADARDLRIEYANILFRLFVWRDMLVEMWDKKPLWGFSFGWPQRSETLEILRHADGEWRRDGWITPHNFTLHVIYRAGFLGLLFIVLFGGFLLYLIKVFTSFNSLKGLLLTSIFINWVIMGQFLVFLEMPYVAIPFWSLLGLTIAYARQLAASSQEGRKAGA